MEKAPDAFRTISEVAEEIHVPQHVLRFWESRFVQIRPLKRGGGRRYYRPDDVDLLRGVRHLLYGEGYTIRGVQRILREEGLAFVQSAWRPGAKPPPPDLADNEAGAAEQQIATRSEDGPSFFGHSPQFGEPANERVAVRRDPTLTPPPVAAASAQQRLGADSEDRRKLQSALDDLIACRSLIDAVLSDPSLSEDIADDRSEGSREI